jgi:hypothetical protein
MRGKKKKTIPLTVLLAYSVDLPYPFQQFTLPILSIYHTLFCQFALPILSISLTYSVRLPYLFCLNLPHLVLSIYLPILYLGNLL